MKQGPGTATMRLDTSRHVLKFRKFKHKLLTDVHWIWHKPSIFYIGPINRNQEDRQPMELENV